MPSSNEDTVVECSRRAAKTQRQKLPSLKLPRRQAQQERSFIILQHERCIFLSANLPVEPDPFWLVKRQKDETTGKWLVWFSFDPASTNSFGPPLNVETMT